MHSYRVTLATLTMLVLVLPSPAIAQRTTPPSFGSNLDVTRSRIGDERVQRQTEVLRMERLLEGIDSRVVRLERQQLRSGRLPAITIAEAEAAVEFAKAQLQESEDQHERGDASKVDVAGDRLALARAQGQLDSAKAAHEENLLSLELDEVYAERQLFELRREKALTEKLAAKGYTTPDALHLLILNEKLAEKELQLVKLRLQTQRKAAGQDSTSDSATDDSPPKANVEASNVPQPSSN
jgi:hypothetical protein